jgi:hypothetical protein
MRPSVHASTQSILTKTRRTLRLFMSSSSGLAESSQRIAESSVGTDATCESPARLRSLTGKGSCARESNGLGYLCGGIPRIPSASGRAPKSLSDICTPVTDFSLTGHQRMTTNRCSLVSRTTREESGGCSTAGTCAVGPTGQPAPNVLNGGAHVKKMTSMG